MDRQSLPLLQIILGRVKLPLLPGKPGYSRIQRSSGYFPARCGTSDKRSAGAKLCIYLNFIVSTETLFGLDLMLVYTRHYLDYQNTASFKLHRDSSIPQSPKCLYIFFFFHLAKCPLRQPAGSSPQINKPGCIRLSASFW